jgi:hypothetical protein
MSSVGIFVKQPSSMLLDIFDLPCAYSFMASQTAHSAPYMMDFYNLFPERIYSYSIFRCSVVRATQLPKRPRI